MDVSKLTTKPADWPMADVPIPGKGKVRVRGLNRLESLYVGAAKNTPERERRMLAKGMVDPPMTEDQAQDWQRSSVGGEIEEVARKIAQLSGMGTGPDENPEKEAYKSV